MKLLLSLLFTVLCFLSSAQSTYKVYFDFDRSDITRTERLRLDSFFNAEKESFYSRQIELRGHCDAKGTNDYNQELSEKRVATVMKYFAGKGLDIFPNGKGYGETQPLNENVTETDRGMNRRVEILFVDPDENDKVTLKEKIADTSVTAGTNIVLRNILFVGGHHQFLPESQPMLVELLDAMQSFPKLVIRVEGHICCQAGPADGIDLGTGIYNLSEARAMAVRDYLLENGIAEARVSSVGYGHSRPIYPFPERTEEEKTGNRRVEIKVISK